MVQPCPRGLSDKNPVRPCGPIPRYGRGPGRSWAVSRRRIPTGGPRSASPRRWSSSSRRSLPRRRRTSGSTRSPGSSSRSTGARRTTPRRRRGSSSGTSRRPASTTRKRNRSARWPMASSRSSTERSPPTWTASPGCMGSVARRHRSSSERPLAFPRSPSTATSLGSRSGFASTARVRTSRRAFGRSTRRRTGSRRRGAWFYMVVVSAGRRRSARSVRSTTSARTRRRRRRCPRRCDPTSKCGDGQQHCVARDDQNALGQTVAGGLERRRRETDRFDQHVADTNERAVIETRIFGQFSGQKRADRDTTKRRGDTKDRCAGRRGESEKSRDHRRDEDAHGNRELLDGWERALRCDASSVLGQKETDPRGLRGSAGSRKVPDSKIKKATTLVVAKTTLVLLLRGLLRLLLCWH